MTQKRLIRNASVISGGRRIQADVLFDDKILAVGENLPADENTRVTDARGLTLLPGLVDVHVHLREPGREAKETIADGTAAAAHGGFTTVFAMPNVLPFPSTVRTVEPYQWLLEEKGRVRVLPYGTITVDEAGATPTAYAALRELGVHWFSDDGVGVDSAAVMRRCLEAAREADVLFACHTEDMNYRQPGASVHDSPVVTSRGWIGIPSACESAQLIRDLKLLKETGGRYHTCHVSAKESVDALREAKAAGQDVTGEVTAHHLLLEDKDVQGPMWKMNPPLRSHEDRMALIEGLESGALDFIANDHAPHTEEEKNQPMDKAPFGIVSLETAFPLLYTEFVKGGRWSLEQLVHWMSTAPARRFGLEGTGDILPGYRADLVLVDENRPGIIDKTTFLSRGKNTPFDKWPTACTIAETICEGRTVWRDTETEKKGS